MRSLLPFAFLSLCLVFFGGCSTKQTGTQDGPPRHVPHNLDRIPDAVPKVEPLSRYGNRFKNSNSYVALKKRYSVMHTSRGYRAEGLASWYGTKFQGKKTSSGEPYNMFCMTAAHRTLPLPTFAKVTNLDNGKSVIVKINDRGPFHNNRLIDLSYVAAHKLGILGRGTGRVSVESVDPRDHGGAVPKPKKPFTRIAGNKNPVLSVEDVSSSASAVHPNNPPLGKPDSGKLYLQMGAFNQKKNAEALARQLDHCSGCKSQIAENLNNNKPRYRVIIGPLKTQKEAKCLREELTAAEFPLPVIITE